MEKSQFSSLLISQSKCLTPQALKFTKDADDAQDLIQDTILKAYLNSDKFTEGTNLRGWLYTIMRNQFVNNYRRKTALFYSIEAEGQSAIDQVASVKNNAESNLSVEHLNKILKSLPKAYCQPLQMYLQGYKYYEITELLSVPLGTIKNRIHLARKIVKEAIGRSYTRRDISA